MILRKKEWEEAEEDAECIVLFSQGHLMHESRDAVR